MQSFEVNVNKIFLKNLDIISSPKNPKANLWSAADLRLSWNKIM
jgi:hypothetical protein